MILVFHDIEGDIVAIESAAIVAIRVGRLEGSKGTVTLVAVPGTTLTIHEPTDEVIALWQESRASATGQSSAQVHPEAIGWRVHPVVEGSNG